MAIEKYDSISLGGIKELIDELRYFEKSVESSGTYTFYADSEGQIPVLQYTSSGVKFSSVGDMSTANNYISSNHSYRPQYVYKTRNGLLLSSAYSGGSWDRIWMALLGKTNNGDVAIVMSTQQSQQSFMNFVSSAYGENAATGLSNLRFRSSYTAPSNANRTSQITGCPVPTCPTSGISYIKGALGLVVSKWDYCWDEIEIGGVRYATNGYLALSDEA